MALKINSSNLVSKCSLEVDDRGVTFFEGAAFASRRTHGFDKIDAILLSVNNELSVHIGEDVFRIPIRPDRPRQREVIDTLLREVARVATPGSQVGALPALVVSNEPLKEDTY